MLQEICETCHNYFIQKVHSGEYTIENGTVSLPFLLDGQRFRIVGSVLNDGVYTYHQGDIHTDDDDEAVGLRDETFSGDVVAMAVPPAVVAMSAEVKEWVEKYRDTVNSPYTSENVIGVYSYTKAQGGSGAGGSVTWQDAFRSRLKAWRKISP